MKLADKICNLRDVAERPPASWDLARRREYFDWAKRVVDGLRGAHPRLEAAFDARATRMTKIAHMDVLLANPRGFCAGVERAIEIVERALELHGAPIYVRHEIVHNKYVVEDLRAKGAVFVEELDEVPAGATVIFSAHGVSQAGARRRRARAASRCSTPPARWSPRCTSRSRKMLRAGYEIVMIGHRGHPEAEGTMGQAARGMHLVETRRRRGAAASVTRPGQARLRHADHAVGRRRARDRRRAARRASRRSAGRRRTTSATPRRTARTRSSSWRRSATW